MRNINKFIASIIIGCTSLTSCNYLDQVPDDVVSLDAVFSTQRDVERFLNTTYNPIPTELNPKSGGGPICDELDFPWPEYDENYINQGSMTPSKGYRQSWGGFYKAIRQASIFISHVDNCPDPNLTAEMRRQYKAEARFLRAFYYFNLFRWYGPLVILPETEFDPDADLSTISIPRSTIEETVQYIYDELERACNEGLLRWYNSPVEYGRATQAAARALQSRLLLYAASPLYNGNTDYEKFAYFKAKDGSPMFNPTYSNEKWVQARNAAKRFIDEFNGQFSLYKNPDNPDNDPMKDYQYLFLEPDWSKNKEIIFARNNCSYWDLEANAPRFVNGWAGYAITQNVVDDYYTEKGLPIKETSWSEKDPDYPANDEGYNPCPEPTRYALEGTDLMYANREPRFYATVCYDNSRWIAPSSTAEEKRPICEFYKGGNTGVSTSRNKSTTGYILRKYSNPNVNWKNSQKVDNRYMAIMRLSEIYLNYAEAENQCDDRNIETVLHYVNLVRERAGLPGWSVGNEPGYNKLKATDKETIAQMIQRERRIELAFENHRFFDIRRWKIYQETDKNGIWGMDINQEERPNFYKRVQTETRPSEFKYYLWPIPQDELYKNKSLIQNPEWEAEQ